MKERVTGLIMKTEELKEIVEFCRTRGISPTLKEICSFGSTALYLSQFQNCKN